MAEKNYNLGKVQLSSFHSQYKYSLSGLPFLPQLTCLSIYGHVVSSYGKCLDSLKTHLPSVTLHHLGSNITLASSSLILSSNAFLCPPIYICKMKLKLYIAHAYNLMKGYIDIYVCVYLSEAS